MRITSNVSSDFQVNNDSHLEQTEDHPMGEVDSFIPGVLADATFGLKRSDLRRFESATPNWWMGVSNVLPDPSTNLSVDKGVARLLAMIGNDDNVHLL